MKKYKGKLARKLLLAIFTTSFLLIIGSFIYFYFSAKSFLFNSAKSEIELYHYNFAQASLSELKEFNNEIDGFLINLDLPLRSEDELIKMLSSYMQMNDGKVDEILISGYKWDSAKSVSSVKVFGGEKVIKVENVDSAYFNDKFYSFYKTYEFYSNSNFGYSQGDNEPLFFIQKEVNDLNIIFNIDMLSLFKSIIDRIYYPPNIDFSIINSENTFEYSTNLKLVNQRWEKYFSTAKSESIFDDELSGSVCGIWNDSIFKNQLVISNDNSKSKAEFNSVILNVFIYSLIILFIIFIFALIYANRVTVSLKEISRVADSVSRGDFNSKLQLSRNDELGFLIDSFNNMIDKLKISYQKLDITNKELESKIEELTKTRSELTKQQKLALIGETISKISHEIQNKISGVSVWVQNLEMHSSDDKSTIMYIQEIKNSLNSFMDMLLNFKKFYRRPFLEKSNVLLEEILQRSLDDHKADLTAKMIKLEKYFSNGNVQISADKNLIEEVFTNILVNAIYFCPIKGSIKVETKLAESGITVEVSNDGPGIAHNDIDNIFNPFFTTKNSGSGLGLAICKNIVEAHEGEISVNNLDTQGVQFTIILPRR